MAYTKLENLINPEVLADMISAKLEDKLAVIPFAKVDTTLVGQPGDTITVPRYGYIGAAEDVAEGAEVSLDELTTTTTKVTVKKIMKAVGLTDEAVLSAYGNPVGEASNQLALSIKEKVDADLLDELYKASHKTVAAGAPVISYNGIVEAIDLFNEETNTPKIIYVHPKQVTQIRKVEGFITPEQYGTKLVATGEVGMIAGCHVIASRKVKLVGGNYQNPIVKLNDETATEDDVPAVKIYLKKGIGVETERKSLSRQTNISIDQHYVASLTNDARVVIANFKAVAE